MCIVYECVRNIDKPGYSLEEAELKIPGLPGMGGTGGCMEAR